MESQIQFGTAQTDITPSPGALMAGQPFACRAQGVESPLYATALTIATGDQPLMIISCDTLLITNDLARRLEQALAAATHIPPTQIVLAATHTHSGPSVTAILGSAMDQSYCELFCRRVTEAARRSVENLQPGRLELAAGECPGYAFNRRFIMSDNTIETHPLKADPQIARPEGPDSTRLMTWIGRDLKGQPKAAIVNFGCHATVLERTNVQISSDYPGKATAALREQLGGKTLALFLQGACGNVCQVNPRDPSRHEVGLAWSRTMGCALAERAVELTPQAQPAVGPLRVLTHTLNLPRRAIAPDLLAWAQAHRPANPPAPVPALSDYGVELFNEQRGPKLALEQFFKTVYWDDFYAREILILDRLSREQPLMPLTLKVVAQNNWAMVTVPGELFVEWSHQIVAHSPFEFTAVVELANGWNGYLPTREAFQRPGGYETKAVTSTMLGPEAGDRVFETTTKLLTAAYQRQG